MTLPVYIPTTNPLCQELQGGHDSYLDGLLLADGHTEDTDGNWLIEAPEAANLVTYRRRQEETTAYVHPVCGAERPRPTQTRHKGRKVYGIRFWTTPNQQENS